MGRRARRRDRSSPGGHPPEAERQNLEARQRRARRLKHQRVANRAASARVRARPLPLAPASPPPRNRGERRGRRHRSPPPTAPPRKSETPNRRHRSLSADDLPRDRNPRRHVRRPRTREPPSRRNGNPTNSRPRIPENAPRAAGPAFSFGVKPKSGTGSLWGAHGKDSPGPAAYYDPYPEIASDAIRGHVPAPRPSALKPPTLGDSDDDVSKKRRRGGGSGYVGRVSGRGPRHARSRSVLRRGKGRDGRRSRAVVHHRRREGRRGKSTLAGGEDVPGPGAYDVVGAPDDGDVRGSRNKGFTFGGKVGVDWASAGPGRDAPPSGKYFRDLDKLGGDVRDSVKGPGGRGPAFSFGTAPRDPATIRRRVPVPAITTATATTIRTRTTRRPRRTRRPRAPLRVHARVPPRTRRRRRVRARGRTNRTCSRKTTTRTPSGRVPRSRSPRNFAWVARVDVSGGQGASPGPGEYDADGDGGRRKSPGARLHRLGESPGSPPERRNARARFPVRDSTPSPRPWGRARPRSRCTRAWRIRTLARRRSCPVPERTASPRPRRGVVAPDARGGVRARPRGVGEHGVGRRGGGPPRSRGVRHERHRATDRERAVVHDGREGRNRRKKSQWSRVVRPRSRGVRPRRGRPRAPRRSFVHVRASRLGRWRLGSPRREGGAARSGAIPRSRRARPSRGGTVVHVRGQDGGSLGRSRGSFGIQRERPGPGEYHDENREPPLGGDGPGFTMYERFPPAGAEAAATGADGPGPALYVGPWTAKDLDRGAGVSPRPG